MSLSNEILVEFKEFRFEFCFHMDESLYHQHLNTHFDCPSAFNSHLPKRERYSYLEIKAR